MANITAEMGRIHHVSPINQDYMENMDYFNTLLSCQSPIRHFVAVYVDIGDFGLDS